MIRFAISLGSNLGDRIQILRNAVEAISGMGDVVMVSSLYETAPVGGPDQGAYLNAVVVVDTDFAPAILLDRLQQIEKEAGRTREIRWGPRTLDLDLVASDGPAIETPRLVVPHPRSGERRFVLEPLNEVWPEANVSGGSQARKALSDVSDQDVTRLSRTWFDSSGRPGWYWVSVQLIWFAFVCLALVLGGELPDNIDPSVAVGGLVAMLGLGLMAWSSASLGHNLTALPEPVTGGQMVSAGPYSQVRHPMYTSVVLIFAGVSITFGAWGALLLSMGLLGFFFVKSIYEEHQLRIAYPDYSQYVDSVPVRFFPHLF